MPKVWIYCDERYPDYNFDARKTSDSEELQITEDELRFILKAKEDYEKAQNIMKRAFMNQRIKK